MGIMIPKRVYTPPLPIIPFLPFTIKKEVIANKIKEAENASENQVQILFGL